MRRIDITIGHIRIFGEYITLDSGHCFWLIHWVNMKADPCLSYAINLTKDELSSLLALMISQNEVTKSDLARISDTLKGLPKKFIAA